MLGNEDKMLEYFRKEFESYKKETSIEKELRYKSLLEENIDTGLIDTIMTMSDVIVSDYNNRKRKEKENNKIVCSFCKHKKALPDGVKCRKCNPNFRNNYEITT